MKKVLVAGTFDILHLGHLYFFKEAKKYGDKLIVVIGSDKITKRNGKKIIHAQKERAELVKSLRMVDEIYFGGIKIVNSIKKIKPDVVCVGYDQTIPKEIEKYCKENEIEIKRIKNKYNVKKCKSSIIRKKILSEE